MTSNTPSSKLNLTDLVINIQRASAQAGQSPREYIETLESRYFSHNRAKARNRRNALLRYLADPTPKPKPEVKRIYVEETRRYGGSHRKYPCVPGRGRWFVGSLPKGTLERLIPQSLKDLLKNKNERAAEMLQAVEKSEDVAKTETATTYESVRAAEIMTSWDALGAPEAAAPSSTGVPPVEQNPPTRAPGTPPPLPRRKHEKDED